MFKRLVILLILAILFGFCCSVCDSYISPEIESDLAIQQMNQSDEAAVELRVASQTLAYQYPIAFVVWLLVAVWLFRSEIKDGLLHFRENM